VLRPEIQFLANARPFFKAGVAKLVAQFANHLTTILAGVGREHRNTLLSVATITFLQMPPKNCSFDYKTLLKHFARNGSPPQVKRQ
jgi:hypothetical protein